MKIKLDFDKKELVVVDLFPIKELHKIIKKFGLEDWSIGIEGYPFYPYPYPYPIYPVYPTFITSGTGTVAETNTTAVVNYKESDLVTYTKDN